MKSHLIKNKKFKGADFKAKFEVADQDEFTTIADLLPIKGEESKAKGIEGMAPIHFASFYGHSTVAELLFAIGVDIESTGNDSIIFESNFFFFKCNELLRRSKLFSSLQLIEIFKSFLKLCFTNIK